jgi:ABC-type multidrug transport system permease subunit
MRTKLSQIVALAEMLALPDLRSPAMYALMLAFPAMFLYLFWLVGGMKLGQHVLFGSLIAIPLNSGIVAVPQSVVGYRYRKLQDMYVASPATQFVYLMGNGLARLLFAVPGMLLLGSLLVWTGAMPLRAIPTVVAVLFLCWAIGCSIGFTLATYMNNLTTVSQFANLLALAMVMLPPVSYPIELVSTQWRWLTLAIPSTSAAQLIKIASGVSHPTSPEYVTFCWLVLALSCLGFLWLASTKSQWRER